MNIKTPAIITSIRSKVDRSIGFSCETPELNNEEKAEFFGLQGLNLNLTIEPTDTDEKETMEIKTEMDEKTPSQRLRSVLFLLFKQQGGDDFNSFYRKTMERCIEQFKSKLD